LTPDGSYSLLYSFCSVPPSCADGSFPGPLLYAPDGNLYGTTGAGGPGNDGVVFRMTTSGALTVLYSFGTARRGAGYNAHGLALGLDGNFYGTTAAGGAHGEGMIYQLTPSGQFTELFSFAALSRQFTNATGALPECPLVLGPDGNFYGTTNLGGTQALGVIFKITPSGRFTVLKDFTSSTGGDPYAPLVVGPDAALYGTTSLDPGTIYKITTGGVFTLLATLTFEDGEGPTAPLYLGTDGNFYGTAEVGGTFDDGTVFQVTPSGLVTPLYSFGTNSGDGVGPFGGLVQGIDGNFYGTTEMGGANGQGVIFKITL
jgi:uncharacterized repeat protein (TIGR03803 family)